MSFVNNPSYTANGNISPSRFVGIVSGTEYKVEQCDASGIPIGVSGAGTQTYDSSYHATAGHTARVHGLGEICLLELGGTVSAGDFLTPDASGKGVKGSLTVSTHQDYGAVAKKNGFSGEFVTVQVHKFSGVMGVSGT
jgi:hypothetical protein